ncbi:MAG: hypothetical protein R6X33_14155 [Candidatus Brocadiia bacterium]
MSKARKVAVSLTEREIQWVEQAVLDGDEESALEFLREVVKPRVDEVLNRPGCKPVFEWGTDMDYRPSGPPDEGWERSPG